MGETGFCSGGGNWVLYIYIYIYIYLLLILFFSGENWLMWGCSSKTPGQKFP